MQTLLAPEVLRMIERIIVVCGGVLCIYLGYLLFRIAVLKQESSGKFKSAFFELTATKVGPGVFFALFGAYILSGSLNHPISSELANGEGPGAPLQARVAAIEKLTDLTSKLPTPERAKARRVILGRRSKLANHQRREAIARREAGEMLAEIAGSYNVGHSKISRLT